MTKEVKRKAKNERLIEKMKKEFLELDFDGDGTISTEEIERVLHTMRIKLKINELDIKHLLKDIDKDKDGSVDLKEYYRYMKGKNGTIMKTNLLYRALFQLSLIRKEFQRFDVDGSGYITRDEVLEVLSARTGAQISDDDATLIFQDADQNQDGKIDYEEFVILMTK